MPRSFAIAAVTLCLFLVTFAVNLQAPLYDRYIGAAGPGSLAATLGFAAYVAGLLPTLLLLGGISDRVGRARPLSVALFLATGATGLLWLWPNWPMLIIARLLLGLATGLVTPAGTAAMAELHRPEHKGKAAHLVTASTALGFGSGALATGISLALQGPTLQPASFAALLLLAPLLALAILTLPRQPLPEKSALLRLPTLPASARVLAAALALAWSATGMTIALVPLALQTRGLGGWSGLVIFLSIFVGFLCQPLAHRVPDHKALPLGLALVPLGFALMLAGLASNQVFLVLIGAGIGSAASYGFLYLAALQETARQVAEIRARATAGILTCAYCGFSLPVIASGALAERIGLLAAMGCFTALLLALSLILARHSGRKAAAPA